MTQQTMFDGTQGFDGKTYDGAKDWRRLDTQLGRVFRLMRDGRWRTLAEITAVTGGSEAGVSARLRDFRKKNRGGHAIHARRRKDKANGLFEYRLIVKND